MNKYRMTLLSFLSLILLSLMTSVLFAQDAGDAEADPTSLDQTQAQQNIKEYSIDSFENEGFWDGSFSRDNGLIQVRTRISTGAQAKPALPTLEDQTSDSSANQDDHILGARIDFQRRAIGEVFVKPLRPIPVEGTVKTVSVWVAGRNSTHVLKLMVRDRFGDHAELYMGKLNFLGWKKLTATIPPYLKQRDLHYGDVGTGILIEGFKIETTLKDSQGRLYVYFDDLRATTDVFDVETNRDPDDPSDNW